MTSARPTTAELSALLTPEEYREVDGALVLTPGGVERMAVGIRWAQTRGRPFTVSRAKFDAVAEPELTSCLVHAEAEARLADVERALNAKGLTLGPLSPHAKSLTVAGWLEGPHLGLRAIPGGRLETAALTLEAVLWNGEVYRSHASPRSAAGPDLDFALLGGRGAVGLLTSALLRAQPLPTTFDRVALRLGSLADAPAILHAALGHEVSPASAELSTSSGAPVLTVTFGNLAFRAHRDAKRLRELGQQRGARVLDSAIEPTDPARLVHDHELGWEHLPRVLEQCAAGGVVLHRIARESVVLSSPERIEGEGVVPLDASPTPPSWLQSLARTLNPGGPR